MKKCIKIAFLLAAVLSLTVFFAACGKGGAEVIDPNLMAGFETEKEIYQTGFINNFGKIEHSDKHVTQGKYSLKAEVHGRLNVIYSQYERFNNPAMVIASENYIFSKTDFSDVGKVSFDVYADDDKDSEIVLFVEGSGVEMVESIAEVGRTTLKANTANNVTFAFSRESVGSKIKLDMIRRFYIAFEGRSSIDDEPMTYYIDNVRIETTTVAVKSTAKTSKPGELCFFDDPDDIYRVFATGADAMCSSRLSINYDLKYVSQGSGSLRIDIPRHSSRTGTEGAIDQTGIRLLRSLFENRDWSDYDANEYSFTFDVYNPSNEPLAVEMQFYSGNKVVYHGITVAPNSWSDKNLTKMPLSAIKQNFVEVEAMDMILFRIPQTPHSSEAPFRTVYIDNISVVSNNT